MLTSGMPLISGCGMMTGGVVTVQHELVYSELQGKRSCPLPGVHGASVGPQKFDGILVRMLKRLPLLGLVYLREYKETVERTVEFDLIWCCYDHSMSEHSAVSRPTGVISNTVSGRMR